MLTFENLQRVGLIAGLAFVAAFVLTFWPNRWRLAAAAVLYVAGILTCTGCFAYHIHTLARMVDISKGTGTPNIFAFIGFILPLWHLGYAAGACVLLRPSIAQTKAMLFGRIWHLTIGLPLIAAQIAYGMAPRNAALDTGWLVYALLWFRIRHCYAACFDPSKCDATDALGEEPPRSGYVPHRLKWGLYFGAWGAVILLTLVTNPAYLLGAASFPVGLIAMLPRGEERAIEVSMLGPAFVGFGWIVYSALSFVISLTKKMSVFSIAYALLCLLLLLNMAGCHKVLEAAAGIH